MLDVEGESANVSRVTEVTKRGPPSFGRWTIRPGLGVERREELLCITPCAVDLRHGAHQLVFASRHDAERSSTAEVVVGEKTTVIRHAIGREHRISPSYTAGIFLAVGGAGLSLVGGAIAATGLDPSPRADGSPVDGTPFLVTGLVVLGVGLVMGATGAILMTSHRPVEQPGATTQWHRQ